VPLTRAKEKQTAVQDRTPFFTEECTWKMLGKRVEFTSATEGAGRPMKNNSEEEWGLEGLRG